MGGEKILYEDEDGTMEQDIGAVVIVPKPTPRHPSSKGAITSVITDYFPALRMDRSNTRMSKEVQPCNRKEDIVDLWMEDEDGLEWFEDQTRICADLTNPEGRMINDMRGDQEDNNHVSYTMGDQEDKYKTYTVGDQEHEHQDQEQDQYYAKIHTAVDKKEKDQLNIYDAFSIADQSPEPTLG